MKRSLNLMSAQARKRELARSCMRFWMRALAAVAVVLVSVGIGKWFECRREQQKQTSAEAEYEPIRQLKVEIARLKTDIQELQTAERIPLRLAEHQPLLGLIGLTTQLVSQQRGQLYLKQIEIEREPIQLDADRESQLSLLIDGVAIESGVASMFADSLRSIGPFAAVELSTSKSQISGQADQHTFSIQCTN